MDLARARSDFRRLAAVCAVLLTTGLGMVAASRTLSRRHAQLATPAPISKTDILAKYGKLPLVFERNVGQTDSQANFLAHGGGYTLFLTQQGAVLRMGGPRLTWQGRNPHVETRLHQQQDAIVRLTFAGSDANAQADGIDTLAGRTNYFIGRDPSRWRTNVPLYGRVKYRDVYPGIDAVYYGNQSRLETDYVVAPGADPDRIALKVEGGKNLKLNPQGDLIIASAAGDLILRRPNVYQEIEGTRREVAASYVERSKNLIGLRLGVYDSREPIIVDPVLDYSTYLGGTGGEFVSGVAADSSGNAYITGSTTAADFPVSTGAYQTTFPASTGSTAFITELNPTGTALVFSTFLGGSLATAGDGIAVDPNGNIYVAGTTTASDFPTTTTTAYQSTAPNGGVFFAQLATGGAQLNYSTYLSGTNGAENAVGLAIAVDPNDNAYNGYIVGRTSDTNFPVTPTAFQVSNNTNQTSPDRGTNFVSRIDPTKIGTASLVYSTFLGGSSAEFPTSIAVDAAENAYVTGNTSSTDYPTVNAYLSAQNNKYGDVFLSRIDTTMSGTSSLIYSTYFGAPSNGFGSASDVGGGIAVQPNSVAVVVGYTYGLAGQFPTTANALQTSTDAPNAIGFLTRFDTTKSGTSSLLYSSTWGGSNTSLAFAAAVDATGNIYMVGATHDTDFPVTPGAPLTSAPGAESAFLSEFDPTGTTSLFSTYWGGGTPPGSAAYAVAVDSASPANAYFAGITVNGFPTSPGALQTTFKASPATAEDGFVTKMSPGAVTGVFASPAILNFGSVVEKASATKTVTLFNLSQAALSNIAVSVTSTNTTDFSIAPNGNTCPSAPATLAAGSNCTISVTFTPTTTSSESATLNIVDSDPSSPQTVSLSGTGTTPPPGVTLSPSPVNFGSVAQGSNSQQGVTLLNNSSSALTITSISTTGATDFTQTNTCPTSSTLAAGTSCTITVTYAPTATGSETATLQVVDSDPSSPQTDTLTGTGTAPSGSVTLGPASINFGNVNVNTTSAAQTATLTNSKTTALTVNSVSITGTNAADFAESNKCGTSLVANSSCTISVTFTPSSSTAESATLTVVDSDATSPQTVALSGTGVASGPDFTLAVTPASATVSAPGTTTATINVTSISGFTSAVTLSCASLPGDSVCTFGQNPLSPAANGVTSTTVTIQTSVGVLTGGNAPSSIRLPRPPVWIAVFGLLTFVLFETWKTGNRKLRRAACVFALVCMAGMAGCTGTPSTPKGSYVVSLRGQAGSAAHTFKFMLTVN